ncbi:MAG: S1C family serine protease [Bryobacteraceae bacterium]
MQGIGEVAERLRRSTVQISSGDRGQGSGVIWASNGTVITNSHVARGNRARVELWNGATYQATVMRRNPRRDLAILRMDSPPDPRDLPAARSAAAAGVRPGELVIAVGNPLGFSGAASTGTLQGVGAVRGLGSQPWVQASIRLAPGNSGGPLANVTGDVIGINTMVASGGIGLAVPSEAVMSALVLPEPKRLGVSARQVRLPDGSSGVLLVDVEPGSPAANASLLPGDVLVEVGARPLQGLDDIAEALENAPEAVNVRFFRWNQRIPRQVTLALGLEMRNNGATEVP